ncbi:phosphotransferase [Amycolatopsis sp. NPDC003865]
MRTIIPFAAGGRRRFSARAGVLFDRFRECLNSLTSTRGGSKKGAYRIHLEGTRTTSVIVYNWAETENFWPGERATDPADPFAPASGLVPFLAAQRSLDELGVRIPRIHLVDDSRRRCPADVAVVEDVPGGTLEVMHRHRSRHYGRIDLLNRSGSVPEVPCQRRVLERALRDLEEAAEHHGRIAAAGRALRDRLQELAGLVRPRAEYGLIHGELGPDHVLIEAGGHPVLIDIEGLMYFDVEWEHVFLRLRFGTHYTTLVRPGLDHRRLDFYMLAMRLSLVAGPLRLLDGDFPDRASMHAIAEHNADAALALLPPG